MNNNLKTAVYGFAIGDALGVPYEFKERGSFAFSGEMIGGGTWGMPKGTWSDDTSMVLATCKSIKDNNLTIDLDDILNNFRKWLYAGYFAIDYITFDVGNTTREAILKGSGLSDFHSCGNGSLMRILPVAFLDDVKYTDVYNVSCMTHANGLCVSKCFWYLVMLRTLSENNDCKSSVKDAFKTLCRIEEVDGKTVDEIKSTGYVKDTIEAVAWCLDNTENYEEAVTKAVNLGGDTDTIAALVGGAAALAYGFDSIPERWINDLRGKSIIESCLF